MAGRAGLTSSGRSWTATPTTLRLPTVLREYGKLAKQAAAEGLDHAQFLARLIELEMIDRERRMIERRIKAAKFPAVKSLDSFDFKAIPALNKMQVLERARCEWIDRRENVIALGPSGTGKTHISLGLGLAACQKGMSVGFTTAAALVHELMEARDERRLLRLQKQMASFKLRISRDWGSDFARSRALVSRHRGQPFRGRGQADRRLHGVRPDGRGQGVSWLFGACFRLRAEGDERCGRGGPGWRQPGWDLQWLHASAQPGVGS